MFNKINLKIVLRRHKKSFIIAVQKIVFPDRSTFNKSDYNQYSNFQKHQRFFNNISMPNNIICSVSYFLYLAIYHNAHPVIYLYVVLRWELMH